MSHTAESLWLQTFQAYRGGLLRRSSTPSTTLPSERFDFLHFLSILGRVSIEERLHLHRVNGLCGSGLDAARERHFEEAEDHFRHAEEVLRILRTTPDSEVAWLFGFSSYQSRLAYLRFRQNKIAEARARCELALDADERLERQGYSLQQMHRIQQGRNFVRIDLQTGLREQAVELTGQLTSYLEGLIDQLPFHRCWHSRALHAVPRPILRAVLHEVLGETASYVVTGADPDSEWRILIASCPLHEVPERAIFPQLQYALLAQRARLEGNLDEYLRNMTAFFNFGIRDCPQLWYSMMVTLVELCLEASSRTSLQVRHVILRDSRKWKGVSPFILDRLRFTLAAQPEAQRNVA